MMEKYFCCCKNCVMSKPDNHLNNRKTDFFSCHSHRRKVESAKYFRWFKSIDIRGGDYCYDYFIPNQRTILNFMKAHGKDDTPYERNICSSCYVDRRYDSL